MRILARHNMHRRTYWPSIRGSNSFANPGAFPALPGPDIVQPVAAAAMALAAFAEAAGLAVFDAETEDCFALFVETKGVDL